MKNRVIHREFFYIEVCLFQKEWLLLIALCCSGMNRLINEFIAEMCVPIIQTRNLSFPKTILCQSTSNKISGKENPV